MKVLGKGQILSFGASCGSLNIQNTAYIMKNVFFKKRILAIQEFKAATLGIFCTVQKRDHGKLDLNRRNKKYFCAFSILKLKSHVWNNI